MSRWARIEAWLIRVLGCGLLLAVIACTRHVPTKPVPASCNVVVFAPCTTANGSTDDTGVRWTADPSSADAWDALIEQAVSPLARKLLTCEVRRQAAVDCLQRLERAGVIVLPEKLDETHDILTTPARKD